MERRHRRQENALAALMDSAPDGILILDPDGKIVLANDAAERLFGYARNELVGEPVEFLVPKRYRAQHVDERQSYKRAPHPRPMGTGLDLSAVRKDGSEFPVDISLSPIPIGDEETGTVAIVRDIAERRAVQQRELELAQARAVERVVESLEAIVWQADGPERTRLRYVGGRADALYGYPRERWLEEGFWLSIVHPDDRLSVLTIAEAAQQQDAVELEYRVLAADGRAVDVRDIVSIHRDEHGTLEHVSGVIVDVSERRDLEARLAQAQKMEAVGQLAGGIAHDFNNLLTIITGHARRLARKPEQAAIRGELGQIAAAAERGADLTRQLLTFARRGNSAPEQLDLGEVAQALTPLLRRLLDEDVAYELVLADGVPPVHADRSQLEQILMNLVVNARDAMAGKGGMLQVAIGAQRLDDESAAALQATPGLYAQISVADTGSGIAPEVRARIFEPFFSTKPPGKGSGLGLATVYGIVQTLGGYIDLETEPGRGTIFRIGLAAAAAAEQLDERTDEEPRATILLVEDEPGIRDLTEMILAEEGFEVLPAADGRAALTLAERHRRQIDLLLTDVVMPGLSGPELVRHLRRLRPQMLVLYMSGYNDSGLVTRGIEEAQVELIQKPFNPDELVARVEALVRLEPRLGAGNGN